MADPFDLARFVAAQEGVIDNARAELGQGHKRGHWMWFVFPQLKGLGKSSMADQYGISSRAESAAYLAHPVLGPRLMECTELVNHVETRSIEAILGGIDALKFRSCMTLFADVQGGENTFTKALDKYFDGQRDPLTMSRLRDA